AIQIVSNGLDFADQGDSKLEYLVEVCDRCEDESCAYLINDILVSDFYTPRYFDPTGLASVRYSFSGKITRPRQVLKNGLFELARPPRRRVPTGQELQSARDHSHPGATGYGSGRAPTARSARPVVAASAAVEPRPEGRAVPEAGPAAELARHCRGQARR